MRERLVPCKNPLCERKTAGALYCCSQCASAHEGRYEIHEDGPLAHSEGCNARWSERQAPNTDRSSE